MLLVIKNMVDVDMSGVGYVKKIIKPINNHFIHVKNINQNKI